VSVGRASGGSLTLEAEALNAAEARKALAFIESHLFEPMSVEAIAAIGRDAMSTLIFLSNIVSRDYFRMLRIVLVTGREFERRDYAASAPSSATQEFRSPMRGARPRFGSRQTAPPAG
jgi:hypothetical protein